MGIKTLDMCASSTALYKTLGCDKLEEIFSTHLVIGRELHGRNTINMLSDFVKQFVPSAYQFASVLVIN